MITVNTLDELVWTAPDIETTSLLFHFKDLGGRYQESAYKSLAEALLADDRFMTARHDEEVEHYIKEMLDVPGETRADFVEWAARKVDLRHVRGRNKKYEYIKDRHESLIYQWAEDGSDYASTADWVKDWAREETCPWRKEYPVVGVSHLRDYAPTPLDEVVGFCDCGAPISSEDFSNKDNLLQYTCLDCYTQEECNHPPAFRRGELYLPYRQILTLTPKLYPIPIEKYFLFDEAP